MEFQPTAREKLNRAFNAAIDAGLVAERSKQLPRKYLGGSRLGHDCLRALWYEYRHKAKDDGRDFEGRTYRIFDMGHDGENRAVEYLKLAGFDLRDRDEFGQQFGFETCKGEDGEGRIQGHLDGIILGGPKLPLVTYPCLWENKALNSKGFGEVQRRGLRLAKPVYYVQAQVYMGYMDLAGCLFTVMNKNTGELLVEWLPFDRETAQRASDRGVQVVTAERAEDLPRAAASRTAETCRWCDYQDRCWAGTIPTAEKNAPVVSEVATDACNKLSTLVGSGGPPTPLVVAAPAWLKG